MLFAVFENGVVQFLQRGSSLVFVFFQIHPVHVLPHGETCFIAGVGTFVVFQFRVEQVPDFRQSAC